MHKILFKLKQLYSLDSYGITVLNSIVLIMSRSHLSIAQPSSFLNVSIHVCHTHPYNLSVLSCYSSTAVFIDCYSELTPYTALANYYGVSVYDVYQFQGHAH